MPRVGDDVLEGGIGRDELTSYGGHDELDGGSSADVLTVDARAGRQPDAGRRDGAATCSPSRALLQGSCVTADGGAGDDELVPTVCRAVHRGKVDVDL